MQNQNMPRRAPQKKGSAGPLFFIIFFVLILLIASFFAFDFLGGSRRPAVEYTIGKTSYKLSAKEAYAGSTLLVCFDDVAALCGMTDVGGSDARSYFAENSEENITFTAGSRTAVLNGKEIDMPAEAVLRDGKMYVPLEMLTQYMGGIAVTETADSVKIERGTYNASTKDTPIYSDTSFAAATDEPLTQPDVKEDKTAPTYSFRTDLSAYEPYMCPEDVDGYLILVNKTTTIDASYVPSNIVNVADSRSDRTERMVETAEKALEAMFIELRAAGYTDVSVTSGYRTYEKQEYLYNLYTEREMKAGISREEAQKIVDTYSAKPGTSEHQTGLCCDMHNLPSADQRFAKQDAYKWLLENCYKFGFILRFPEDKEDITGYSFEPWHYRFVGRYHASEMHRLGMCLEEYVAYLETAE